MKNHIRRLHYVMPTFVLRELTKHRLVSAYESRPPFQRNEYLAWIIRAKLDFTRKNRISQMIGELKKGDVYMGMYYKPKNAPK